MMGAGILEEFDAACICWIGGTARFMGNFGTADGRVRRRDRYNDDLRTLTRGVAVYGRGLEGKGDTGPNLSESLLEKAKFDSSQLQPAFRDAPAPT